MGREIELKLLVTDEQAGRLRGHPLVTRFAVGERSVRHLSTIYYDTPDFWLLHHATALRVRREGDRYVQTLKTAGVGVGGMTQRGEWELPLTDNVLQPGVFPADLWPPGRAGRIERLNPLFFTDFERETYLVHIPAGALSSMQAEAKIEFALDRGEVWVEGAGGKRTDAIREIEMELVSGDPATLFDFALAVSAEVSVQPCDISKAQRGYRLMGVGFFSDGQEIVMPAADAVAGDVFSDELTIALGVWNRRLEYFQHAGGPAHLEAVKRAIGHICRVLVLFRDLVPEAQAHQWEKLLAAAIGCGRAGDISDEQGRVMLALAAWIYRRGWRIGQTDKQCQSAAMAVSEFAGAKWPDVMDEWRDYRKAVSPA